MEYETGKLFWGKGKRMNKLKCFPKIDRKPIHTKRNKNICKQIIGQMHQKQKKKCIAIGKHNYLCVFEPNNLKTIICAVHKTIMR